MVGLQCAAVIAGQSRYAHTIQRWEQQQRLVFHHAESFCFSKCVSSLYPLTTSRQRRRHRIKVACGQRRVAQRDSASVGVYCVLHSLCPRSQARSAHLPWNHRGARERTRAWLDVYYQCPKKGRQRRRCPQMPSEGLTVESGKHACSGLADDKGTGGRTPRGARMGAAAAGDSDVGAITGWRKRRKEKRDE